MLYCGGEETKISGIITCLEPNRNSYYLAESRHVLLENMYGKILFEDGLTGLTYQVYEKFCDFVEKGIQTRD